MKVYKWSGSGHYLPAVVIVIADCKKSAIEFIEKELIDNGLSKSWEESRDIEVFCITDCNIIHSDNGDY